MPGSEARLAYSRDEVRRLLSLSERQLGSWEKQKFIPATEVFTFSDLLALRTLTALRKSNLSAAQIRSGLDALREKLSHVQNPLSELKVSSHGKKIRVQIDGGIMEAISGQLVLDFDESVIAKLLAFPVKEEPAANAATKHSKRIEAERWFEKGLHLEQTGARLEDIIQAYVKAVEIDPNSTGAMVNLGTVYFNARRWKDAERCYLRALSVDSKYALAHFNLGNLFDEKGDRAKALKHYLDALEIHPNYGDAHYNVALLFQATGQPLKAVSHWKAFLKVDGNSSWAAIARRELDKLRASTIVHGLGKPLHRRERAAGDTLD